MVLGDHNRNITEASETVYKVVNFYIHGGYSRPHIGMNDIAIIKLEKPVRMTDKIQRICLPDVNEELSDGTECYITGRIQSIICYLLNKICSLKGLTKVLKFLKFCLVSILLFLFIYFLLKQLHVKPLLLELIGKKLFWSVSIEILTSSVGV